ncbi:MAG: CoA-binding protein [Chloroflexi bacterium]|nr:CoA-binding protein [Chloroflexota bacterium]
MTYPHRDHPNRHDLDYFFAPRSVAVVGASHNPQKLGYFLMDNLLRERFPGPIYPVNPRGGTILGLKVYPAVQEIPGPVDLAVIAVPAPLVVAALEECGRKGARAAVVISAGFKETGPEGALREQEVAATARRYGIRLVGPNCLGVIDTFHSLNASFAEAMPERWEVAVMSQSGAMATAILDWSRWTDVGFSKFVSLGNMADVTEAELLEYWAEDRETNVVVGYLEGISNGRHFMEAARRLTRNKPLVIMKVGRTAAGARAASSHTGTLATVDYVVEAAFRQTGVVRAETMEELFDFTRCFAYSPLPRGDRVAVVTNAGGPGVMATDAIDRVGLRLATLLPQTQRLLIGALPEAASVQNPVDVLGDAQADRYDAALGAVVADPGVDCVLVLLTPQAMTEPERTARTIISNSRTADKPILVVYMGGVAVERGRHMLERARVPVYFYPERAVRAMAVLVQYARYRRETEELAAPAVARAG